ncbi:HIRA-interacting protein 3-like [Erythrolamprus reginae]|uniref:HIRA-interacting protein 3-like n=1 Tax=Erythrolamprus reginae TaxID=121349 RepID=UPI00396D01D1
MARGSAGMRDFVSRIFQGNPDLSILTHAIIRKQYLDYVGMENMSNEEKQQLRDVVEEELLQMKVDPLPSNEESRTEIQDSFKTENRKRPLQVSSSSEDEIKNEQEQKRQKIENDIEITSDEKDSGIDSKKRPCHGSPKIISLDSSDQGDSGAENHSSESESNEEPPNSKRKPSPQDARRLGRRSPNGQEIRGSQKREVSESEDTTTDTEQSGLKEEVNKHRKITKENNLRQRGFKKKVGEGSKTTDPRGRGKNRMMTKQREESSLSEGGTDLSEIEEISEEKREPSESEENKTFRTNKAQRRVSRGTQMHLKRNESEVPSGSGRRRNLQKKMAGSQCGRKRRVMEDSESSSEDSASQSPIRKEGAKRARGGRGGQQLGNGSKLERKRQESRKKKLQREDLHRKKLEKVKVTQRIQESFSDESKSDESKSDESKSDESKSDESKSDESKSDSGGQKGVEAEERVQDPASNEGESQSETNQGPPGKKALIGHPSESESDESEDGDPRTPEKESEQSSGCDSSQGEEKLKKRGAQKSERKSIDKETSPFGSEGSRSRSARKGKTQSQQQRRRKKPQKRRPSKEKEGKESSQEESSSSEEDKPTTSQQHRLRKDKKHHSGKKEEHSSILFLKRLIWECGVRQNYKKLLAGCHSDEAQIEILKRQLSNIGIKGTPTLAKCKALKQKREEQAELDSLDVNNIIVTEGRPRRQKVWSLYNKSPSSPDESIVRRKTTDWSRLRGVISSDEESS